MLALEHGEIPPSLHFEQPNPRIDFAASPFYVNTEPRRWPAADGTRGAPASAPSASAAPTRTWCWKRPPSPSRRAPVPPLAAPGALGRARRTALEAATDRLAAHLESSRSRLADFADAASDLQAGRARLRPPAGGGLPGPARTPATLLAARDPRRVLTGERDPERPAGRRLPAPRPRRALSAGMGQRPLPRRARLPRRAGPLRRAPAAAAGPGPARGALSGRRTAGGGRDGRLDLRPSWAAPAGGEGDRGPLRETAWRSRRSSPSSTPWPAAPGWGLVPRGPARLQPGRVRGRLPGRRLVPGGRPARGGRAGARLIEELPAGAMLAVPLSEAEVLPRCSATTCPSRRSTVRSCCVVAGPSAAVVAALERELAERGLAAAACRPPTPSTRGMMEPAAGAFAAPARGQSICGRRRSPTSPTSPAPGSPREEATDPAGWARHLLEPVRFAAGLSRDRPTAGQAPRRSRPRPEP